VQAILSPARLRQLGMRSGDAFDAIERLAVGAADPADRAELTAGFRRDQCRAELTFLDDPSVEAPEGLRACSLAIATRLHREVLRAELPGLVAAVQQDLAAGSSKATVPFVDRYVLARTEREKISAREAFTLFRDARLGEQRLKDEAGSDLFARTAS